MDVASDQELKSQVAPSRICPRTTNRLTDAEQTYTEALSLRRELMKANPIAYTPDVAFTLSDLGSLYKSKGQSAESARACGESTDIFRQLAASDQATPQSTR